MPRLATSLGGSEPPLDGGGAKRHTDLMFSYAAQSLPPILPPGARRNGALVPPLPQLWRVADGARRRAFSTPGDSGEQAAQRVLARDPTYAAKVKRVRRYQARLRRQLSAPAWQAYLQLEEAEIERWAYAFERVARWALGVRRRTQGR